MTTTVTAKGPALPIHPQGSSRTPDPELIADARRLSDALGELIRVVQFRDRDRACCYDISVSQCYSLKGVVDAGGLTVNDLAAHLYTDKSTASRIANALVAKGLATRQRDAADGRIVRVVATAKGRSTCAAIEADLAAEYAELLADLDGEVRSAVARVVSRLGRSFAARVEVAGGSCCVVR